eukprot:gene4545-7929_t
MNTKEIYKGEGDANHKKQFDFTVQQELPLLYIKFYRDYGKTFKISRKDKKELKISRTSHHIVNTTIWKIESPQKGFYQIEVYGHTGSHRIDSLYSFKVFYPVFDFEPPKPTIKVHRMKNIKISFGLFLDDSIEIIIHFKDSNLKQTVKDGFEMKSSFTESTFFRYLLKYKGYQSPFSEWWEVFPVQKYLFFRIHDNLLYKGKLSVEIDTLKSDYFSKSRNYTMEYEYNNGCIDAGCKSKKDVFVTKKSIRNNTHFKFILKYDSCIIYEKECFFSIPNCHSLFNLNECGVLKFTNISGNGEKIKLYMNGTMKIKKLEEEDTIDGWYQDVLNNYLEKYSLTVLSNREMILNGKHKISKSENQWILEYKLDNNKITKYLLQGELIIPRDQLNLSNKLIDLSFHWR